MPNRRTLLICEDEANLRELVRASLGPDYRFVEASSVAEAEEALRLSAPDAVLLDLMLPGGSGLDVLRAIRRRPGRRIPVVVVSAWTTADYRDAATRPGPTPSCRSRSSPTSSQRSWRGYSCEGAVAPPDHDRLPHADRERGARARDHGRHDRARSRGVVAAAGDHRRGEGEGHADGRAAPADRHGRARVEPPRLPADLEQALPGVVGARAPADSARRAAARCLRRRRSGAARAGGGARVGYPRLRLRLRPPADRARPAEPRDRPLEDGLRRGQAAERPPAAAIRRAGGLGERADGRARGGCATGLDDRDGVGDRRTGLLRAADHRHRRGRRPGALAPAEARGGGRERDRERASSRHGFPRRGLPSSPSSAARSTRWPRRSTRAGARCSSRTGSSRRTSAARPS